MIVVRAKTLEREPSKKKQRADTKKDTKRMKSDNFTRRNREKSNIAIAIRGHSRSLFLLFMLLID